MVSTMASVSLLFLGGVAFTTWRHRNPLRCTPSAIVRGEGHGSSPYSGSLSAFKAAWAVSRVERKLVRNVGAGCAWASARCRSAWATCGGCSSQRLGPRKADGAPRQRIPVRLSASPSATVWRPQPTRASAIRGLPLPYFNVISASTARRVGPGMFDAARRRAAICDGRSAGWRSNVGCGMHMRGPRQESRVSHTWRII
jgi:hypothetical protein